MQPQMPGTQTIPLQSPQGPLPRIGEIQEDDRIPMGQQSTRRVSFGSVFDASSGQNEGGHNNEENLNEWGEPQNERNAPTTEHCIVQAGNQTEGSPDVLWTGSRRCVNVDLQGL